MRLTDLAHREARVAELAARHDPVHLEAARDALRRKLAGMRFNLEASGELRAELQAAAGGVPELGAGPR